MAADVTTADQVLAVARSQIGTVEDSSGHQKYGQWYGMDRVAWCAIFTQWCFAQVQASDLIPRTAYTPTYYEWFQRRQQATSAPQPGDLVFYNWPDSVNRIQHVGFVEAVEPAAIVTVEGNTTSGVAGNQSNGGGVWRRRRARNSSVVGFGRPLYSAAPAPVAPSPPARPSSLLSPEDDVMYVISQLTPSGPPAYAILCGPMFVGLGSSGEVSDAKRAISAGAPYQWVERFTWQELDRRSHNLCDNPRPVAVTNLPASGSQQPAT